MGGGGGRGYENSQNPILVSVILPASLTTFKDQGQADEPKMKSSDIFNRTPSLPLPTSTKNRSKQLVDSTFIWRDGVGESRMRLTSKFCFVTWIVFSLYSSVLSLNRSTVSTRTNRFYMCRPRNKNSEHSVTTIGTITTIIILGNICCWFLKS